MNDEVKQIVERIEALPDGGGVLAAWSTAENGEYKFEAKLAVGTEVQAVGAIAGLKSLVTALREAKEKVERCQCGSEKRVEALGE